MHKLFFLKKKREKKWNFDLSTQPPTVVCKVDSRFCTTCMLSRCLVTKVSASELSRKFIKSALLVGRVRDGGACVGISGDWNVACRSRLPTFLFSLSVSETVSDCTPVKQKKTFLFFKHTDLKSAFRTLKKEYMFKNQDMSHFSLLLLLLLPRCTTPKIFFFPPTPIPTPTPTPCARLHDAHARPPLTRSLHPLVKERKRT